MKIRRQATAGSFYPASGDEARKMLKDFFKKVKDDAAFTGVKENLKDKKIKGLIVPHAGWMYSGLAAAYAYSLLEDNKHAENIKRVIMLGPSHTVFLDRIAVEQSDAWETPFGMVDVLRSNIKHNLFIDSSITHREEHSLELQLPFLMHALRKRGKFKILPLIVGDITDRDAEIIAGLLLQNYCSEDVRDDFLFIISTDFSHYKPAEIAEKLDKNSIKILEEMEFEKMSMLDACGRNPLKIAMFLCKKLNTKPQLLTYMHSGDITGDYDGVVGYGALWF